MKGFSSFVSSLKVALNVCLILELSQNTRAGDILRGGLPAPIAQTGAAQSAGAATTLPSGANRNDSLARTAQALQAVKTMQAAARTLAQKGPNNLGLDPNHPGLQLPNVPNGLTTGGLQVAPGVPQNLSHPVAAEDPTLWTGANLPTQSVSNGQTNVNIKQTAQQALLNWQTFNVGKNTSVTFDQTAGGANASQWIAFNTINDPLGVPSQILGSLSALGQVYLINQNGIIFGGSSQVNLHTLVASSLPINTNLINRGLLNNPDDQFLFSSLAIPILPNGGTMPAFNPPPPPDTPGGRIGDVTVQAGASLSSPTTPDHVGGRIALIGPNVTNEGTISTPDGQTILAAGQQVGFAAHATSDPSLRGLDVFIGEVDPISGTATNSGLVEAARADTTIAGKTVNQLGFIDSSTSVALNGRVDLLADYNTIVSIAVGVPHFNPSLSGTVTLGPGSVTQILPEVDSTETIVGSQLALPSQANFQGNAVHLAENSLLVAPGADVNLSAGAWLPFSAGYSFTYSEGQIYLDSGALIDVSGSRDVSGSVTDNIVAAQLLGPELANSPLQRNGPLRGQTVLVDIRDHGPFDPTLNNGQGGYTWIGTPLADVSGYVNLIQRNVGQLTIGGGTVSLTAGESVVMQAGSKVDVSGGWIDYAGGFVETTQVVSGGRIFDIAEATPDRIYSGISSGFQDVHSKWGVTETFANSFGSNRHFEEGYAQGGDGGSISVTAPGAALDGSFAGNTVLGPRLQSTAPVPSNLSLDFVAQQPISPLFLPTSPTPPNLTFDPTSTLAPADPFELDSYGKALPLRDDRRAEVILSPDLVNLDGFGRLAVNNSDGDISVPSNINLTTAPSGSVNLQGANIDVQGHISSPGGMISLTAYDFSPYELALLKVTPGAQTPPADPTRGRLTLGGSASLSVTGLTIDDRIASLTPETVPAVTTGGQINLKGYNTTLVSGSSIDVSGGVQVSASNKATFGSAGSIVITGGEDPNVPSILGGSLTLDADLRGYAGNQSGGSLSVLAPLIQIGGVAAQPDTLTLQPAFFSRNGFSSFTLTGIGMAADQPNDYIPGLLVTPDTTVAPVVQSWFLNDTGPITLTPVVLTPALRSPVSLSFIALGVRDSFNGDLISRGDLILSAGSALAAGVNGHVSLSGDTVAVESSVTAPGGSISVAGATNSTLLFTDSSTALPTVDLAPESILSVAGTTLLTPNALGFRTGSVLPGGSISVSGNIVAEAGARLDVSGASGLLDLAPEFSNTTVTSNLTPTPLIATQVESNAGSITFGGGQELFLDATLLGASGGPSALGGNLTISSSRFYSPDTSSPPTPLDITLMVTQNSPTIPTAFYSAGETAIGHAVVDLDGKTVDGLGHFSASTLDNHEFDQVTLKGTVDFVGPVNLSANRILTVGTSGVIYSDSPANLTAPYVAVGQAFQPPMSPLNPIAPFTVAGHPFYFSPTAGPGVLNISGSLIDIGNLSLQNIGTANLIATNGDIRGDGTLDVAGAISMTAGQIYPPTGVAFTVSASNYSFDGITYPGSIAINASGSRPLPLSAGGQLNLYAALIDQSGTLRAPIGTINVGDGVITNPPTDPITNQPVAPTQRLTVGPQSITSVSALDPVTGQSLVIPYGTNPHGTSWIDPAGVDITTGGVPGKVINVASVNVDDQTNSLVDLRGGGDLLAYRFLPGVGGTIDILGSTSSFAIVPGYQFNYAPFDPLYGNSSLAIGEQVYLNSGSGVKAGVYTLLPARYALLPGAFLITPKQGTPETDVAQPDGSTLVSGYVINSLGKTTQPLFSSFEVAPPAVIQARATYQTFSADTFLQQGALAHDQPVPRLPVDAGELVLAATSSMNLNGRVTSQAPQGALGGLVDISSPTDILIAPTGSAPGILRLDPHELSTFGADSLLIGGFRQSNSDGSLVTVTTGNVTVDNYGAPLTGPDIILVANNSVLVNPRSDIEQTGALAAPAETLLFGDDNTAGSGNGALLRLSSDPAAQIVRSGVATATTAPNLVVAENVHLSGQSIILDSTSAMRVEPSAMISGSSVSLDSGQISLVLSNPGALNPTTGLVLYSSVLQGIEATAQSLSLLSYSSFDIYGIGQVGALDSAGQPALASLALHAGEIRAFNNLGGTVFFQARDILLDNSPDSAPVGAVVPSAGTLVFSGDTIELGRNQLAVDQFNTLTLAARSAVLLEESGGLANQGTITINTPLITAAAGAQQSLTATGDLTITTPVTPSSSSLTSGLGASLTLTGANVTAGGNLTLPSGVVTLHATTGNVLVAGTIDVSGTAQNFFDVTKYTNAGEVNLTSDLGYVLVPSGSIINVSAQAEGGDAGLIAINTPAGFFLPGGRLLGSAGATGLAGSFSLDTGELGRLAPLDSYLDAGGFTLARSIRVRSGDVLADGTTSAHSFNLSTDQGSITVIGTIDASGTVGGQIDLEASNNVTLADGSLLTVAADQLNAAGQGGAVSLETTHGTLELAAGSKVDLSVGNSVGGSLHLRAPQNSSATDLAINSINGTIVHASSIVAEGYFAQDASTPGGAAIDDYEATALANATAFEGNAAAIQSRVLANNSSLQSVFHVRPGEEIDNSQGDLVLNKDLDLSTWRFGEKKPVVDSQGNFLYDYFGNQIFAGVEPGVLTLRARGSIILNGSLSDGFGDSGGDIPFDNSGNPAPWLETVLPKFADGTSQQSWAFRITTGADFSAADFRRVQPLANLAADSGSLMIGVNGGANIVREPGSLDSDSAIEGHYQVIRTGTGDIDISVGRDLQLLNQFATIYTGGTQVKDPTLGGTFDTPRVFSDPDGFFPAYPAQYTSGGGNVSIAAQNDIVHLTQDINGNLIPDSERELPVSWLDRRGYVDPATGEYGVALFGDVASTSWWIDFSNFFEGIGALGGGNVTLKAGHDISNVDAVVPTNARAPIGVPDAGKLVELGGGNLLVQAGHDIDGGVYYIERGLGTLTAGNSIHTNSTRSPSLTIITNDDPFPAETWMPTTLFLGKGTFNVQASGDILLGPVANPFLLPPGLQNTYWYKTYFSTYAATSAVNISSLNGSITLRNAITLPTADVGGVIPVLQAWFQNQLIADGFGDTAAFYQPWLSSAETDASPFLVETELLPPTLRATAFSGDIDLSLRASLYPSATGTLDLVAGGAINALQVNGQTTINNLPTNSWAASTINLSDADPNSIPGAASPFAYQVVVGTNTALASVTGTDFLTFVDQHFSESGSTEGTFGVLQTKQALHAQDLLHLDDPLPVHLYASNGDISGLTLYSAKTARIVAGQDITDVAFYIQNDNPSDVTVVAAGRDMTLYDPNSVLRSEARASGNALDFDESPLAGDIQINGPGTLEVLAGRNLDLGIGNNNLDGTGLGITSIGNGRNPFLPFGGSDVIAGAGIGVAPNLSNSQLAFDSFISQFLDPNTAPAQATRYLPDAGMLLGLVDSSSDEIWSAFQQLTVEKQDQIALDIFYLVLRDAGRDHNDPASGGFNNFDAANTAISALFPGDAWAGDISLTSREIKTQNGGDINLFSPGGGLTVGFDVGENQAVDQGILTEHGGNISIFARDSVTLGTSRIFTLRGGNEIIYSAEGDIAAGASSKTVLAAPPTRVLIDPQSADVQTDLAGLATGGGIGVLESVAGVPPGDVDLIAPTGTVDAGDAGIRVSGNLSISAVLVLNTANIQVGGASAGVPVVSAPNIGSLTAASNSVAATSNAAAETSQQGREDTSLSNSASIVTVEVLGYGGGENDQNEDDPRKRKKL